MKLTIEEANEIMERNGGNLDLSGTPIQSLPEGLTVGGSLYLNGTQIQALPEGLTVGGWLDLRDTQIQSLPEGLTVGGDLYLSGSRIQALPEGLTVGGWLDLSGSRIQALPEGLTVGGGLDLIGSRIHVSERNKVITLKNGDYVPGRYLYADRILTHVRTAKCINGYTLYIGKIPGRNVVSDGTNYAHCEKFRDGIADLLFKAAKDRGADQYKSYTLDTELTVEEAVTMYRVITGACRQGSQSFVNGLQNLKEKYTIRECIELTKGQYNAERFAEFFGC